MAVKIPFVREMRFAYGEAEPVTPLVRRVVARNPSLFTLYGTNTYVVGRGRVAVIDPGPLLKEHQAALRRALGGETVTHILVTHSHLDHCEGATGPGAGDGGAAGRGCPGRPAVRFPGHHHEEEVDRAFAPDALLGRGDRVAGPGWTLEAVPTPGHTSDHLCFALPEEGLLFTGDHVMGWSTSVVIPPDGDMRRTWRRCGCSQARRTTAPSCPATARPSPTPAPTSRRWRRTGPSGRPRSWPRPGGGAPLHPRHRRGGLRRRGPPPAPGRRPLGAGPLARPGRREAGWTATGIPRLDAEFRRHEPTPLEVAHRRCHDGRMAARPLTPDERSALLADHPDWSGAGEVMERTIAFADFAEAMGFVNRVALAAQAADHHPDIDIRWNRVTLRLTTHSAGALTDLDRELAETIDGFLGLKAGSTLPPDSGAGSALRPRPALAPAVATLAAPQGPPQQRTPPWSRTGTQGRQEPAHPGGRRGAPAPGHGFGDPTTYTRSAADDFRSDQRLRKGFGTLTRDRQCGRRVDHADSGNQGRSRRGTCSGDRGSGIIHQEMATWAARLPCPRRQGRPRLTAADILRRGRRDRSGHRRHGGRGDGPVTDMVTRPYCVRACRRRVLPLHPAGHAVFAYVIGGGGVFCEQGDPYSYEAEGAGYFDMERSPLIGDGHLVLFGDGDSVAVGTQREPVRFLLISGKPIGEPVAWYGPIVMNTQEELRLAFEELERGTFIKASQGTT